MKYGLEIYAPIGPGGHFLESVGLFGGMRVFDANPKVEEALKERGPLVAPRSVRAPVPALLALPQPGDLPGDVAVVHQPGRRPAQDRHGPPAREARTARHGMDAQAGGRADAARGGHRRGRSPRQMDPRVGPRPHLQHDREPARLVHLAPARLGRADSGGRLRGVRRSDRHDGAGRADGDGLRTVRRRRVVRAARPRSSSPGADVSVLRRIRIRARDEHPRRVVRLGIEPRGGAVGPPGPDVAGRHLPRRQRPASRLVPELAARRPRHARPPAVPRGGHARLHRRRGRPEDVEVARQLDRAGRTSSSRAAPTSCASGSR